MTKPLAIDLFCGLGGWTEGLLSEGYDVVGFDIEQHIYGVDRYPGMLAVQDVLTLHGSQFRKAALIVASPPCQEYSYMAMPWKRARQIARALRGEDVFPANYKGSRTIAELNALFDACFRIQREACEAAGRHIPLVVENVKGAQPWVGAAAWRFGSFYLWGNVPALMPATARRRKSSHEPIAGVPEGVGATSWFHGNSKHEARHYGATKNQGGSWFNVAHNTTSGHGQNPDGRKIGNRNIGRETTGEHKWTSSWSGETKPSLRKAASARIAKIPFALAQHVAQVYHPARAA